MSTELCELCKTIGICRLIAEVNSQAAVGGFRASPRWPRTTWNKYTKRVIQQANQDRCPQKAELEAQIATITQSKESAGELY